MKKYLSIYTLLVLTCIVLQSCLFSEEEIFDESSANRATADVIKCQEIFQASLVDGTDVNTAAEELQNMVNKLDK